MMTRQSFEIRVALVGYVSVGKSTVLNALLGDKFSQVSMRRTTAGVNFFRIANKNINDKKGEGAKSSLQQTSSLLWTTNEENKATKSASSTHKEISEDNQALRSSNDVHEKTFDIELDEPICEMRDDTQLVLIDIPGINEADSSSKYKDYVTKKWNMFDCVVVVMDAIQGVNTEEQVELLRFVQKNNREKKDLPTIILGNKMDDPDDEEKLEMVKESRLKAMEIFGKGCSEASLDKLIKAASGGNAGTTKTSAFIPISAMTAFMYRMVAHLSFEQFKLADKTLLDKIGVEEVGRSWKRMSAKAKYDKIRTMVSDPEEYKERISSSNFDAFLSVLAYFVGGKKNQTALLKQQLQVKLNLLAPDENLVEQIKAAHDIAQGIGETAPNLPYHFWRVYMALERDACASFNVGLDPSVLKRPLTQLMQFLELSKMYKWVAQETKVTNQATRLVSRQLSLIAKKGTEWDFSTWFNKAYNNQQFVHLKRDSWDDLSPEDWVNLLSAALLVSNDLHFVENLGAQKITLDRLLLSFASMSDGSLLNFRFGSFCGNCTSNRSSYNYNSSSLVVPNPHQSCPSGNQQCSQFKRYAYFQAQKGPETKKVIAALKVPEKLSSPSHWGHLAWEYVRFCRKIDKN